MGVEGWPKSARLRKRREFLRVQRQGTKAQGQFLTALAQRGRPGRRLGVTVSTKVGNSVVRSKIKRRLREAFRKNRALLPDGIDLVLIARPGTDRASLAELVRDLERVGRALQVKLSTDLAVKSRSPKPGRPRRP